MHSTKPLPFDYLKKDARQIMCKIFFVLLLTNCQSLSSWNGHQNNQEEVESEQVSKENDHAESKKNAKQPGSEKQNADVASDSLAHKQAVMWARISDLEDQLQEEKAKVELLQKKQRTGLDFKPKKRIVIEDDEAPDPIHISLFGAIRIMFDANGLAHLI